MTIVDLAERRARGRAVSFLILAALIVALMLIDNGGRGTDFAQGLWAGVIAASAFWLTPIARFIRPGSTMVRLLDDEVTQEYRRISCTVGFWAASASAIMLAFVTQFGPGVAGRDVAQIVATSAVATAMTAFAVLELRAAR